MTDRATAVRNLHRAWEVRAVRAKLREQLRQGEVDSLALLRGEVPEWEQTISAWRLNTLMPLIPGVGQTIEAVIYSIGRFPPAVRIGALSGERRLELAATTEQHRKIPHNARGR